MTTVTYRPFRAADFDAVAAIVGEAWHGDDRRHAAFRRPSSRCDAAHFLARTTFALVAEADGAIVGVVCARCGTVPAEVSAPWKREQRRALDEARAVDPDSCRFLEAFLASEHRIDARLLADSQLDPDHEIVLLAVSRAARGLGVGRQLFELACAHLHQQGAHQAHLFTDTSCTWQFYEHLGFTRAGALAPAEHGCPNLNETYFIYRIDL